MTNKINGQVVIRCLGAGALFFLIAYWSVEQAANAEGMESFLLMVFGGIEDRSLMALIGGLLTKGIPMVFFFYVFGACFHQDFIISFIYGFTRLNNRKSWLDKKALFLAAQALVAWLWIFLVCYLFGVLYGLEQNAGFGLVALLFLTNFLPFLALTFLQNCISIWIGVTKSFFLLLAFYLLSLAFGVLTAAQPACSQFVFYLLPPVNGMYLWHEAALSPPAEERLAQLAIEGFSLWKSFASCIVWMSVVYGAALHKMKHCDLLEIGKEG